MRGRVIDGFWRRVGEHPFAVLLIALVTMMMLSPSFQIVVKDFPVMTGLNMLAPLSLIVIGASSLTLWRQARHHALHMVATGLVIASLMLGSVITHRAYVTVQLLMEILFLANVIVVVIRSVFSARDVTTDILCGAVCIYLLTGVLIGFVYVLIEVLSPGSFHLAGTDEVTVRSKDLLLKDPGWLIYFSFITLTTVGYGDIVPNIGVARSVAVMEAVIGQVLLVVQISRLVAMHVAQNQPNTIASGADEDQDG